jgi:ATP-dependent DNA ligase
VRYCIFDAPAVPAVFNVRLWHAARLALPEHAGIVQHATCEGLDDLARHFVGVVNAGGEGLVMRRPNGLYLSGQRSMDVLKVKMHPYRVGMMAG